MNTAAKTNRVSRKNITKLPKQPSRSVKQPSNKVPRTLKQPSKTSKKPSSQPKTATTRKRKRKADEEADDEDLAAGLTGVEKTDVPGNEQFVTDPNKLWLEQVPRKNLADMKKIMQFSAEEAFTWAFRMHPKAKLIYGNGTVKILENARKWWEPTSATSQCNNTIGKFVPNQSKCYICGEIIGKTEQECEHILPVFQGSLLLSLYKTSDKSRADIQKMQEWKLEYDWAHECCNQIKSEKSFLTFTNAFVYDKKYAEDMLKAILSGKNKDGTPKNYCNTLRQRLNNSKWSSKQTEAWIASRVASIQTSKIQPICNLMNHLMNKSKGLFYLSIVINLMSAANRDIMDKIQGIIPEPPNETTLRLEMHIHLANSLAPFFTNETHFKIPIQGNKMLLDLLVTRLFHDGSPVELHEKEYKKRVDADRLMNYLMASCFTRALAPSASSSTFTFKRLIRDMFCVLSMTDLAIARPQAADIAGSTYKLAWYAALLERLNDLETNKRTIFAQALGNMSTRNLENVFASMTYTTTMYRKFLGEEIKKVLQQIQGKARDASRVFSVINHILNSIGYSVTSQIVSYNPSLTLDTPSDAYIGHEAVLARRVEYYERYASELEAIDADDIDKLEVFAVNALKQMKTDANIAQVLSQDLEIVPLPDTRILSPVLPQTPPTPAAEQPQQPKQPTTEKPEKKSPPPTTEVPRPVPKPQSKSTTEMETQAAQTLAAMRQEPVPAPAQPTTFVDMIRRSLGFGSSSTQQTQKRARLGSRPSNPSPSIPRTQGGTG